MRGLKPQEFHAANKVIPTFSSSSLSAIEGPSDNCFLANVLTPKFRFTDNEVFFWGWDLQISILHIICNHWNAVHSHMREEYAHTLYWYNCSIYWGFRIISTISVLEPPIFPHKVHLHSIDYVPTWLLVSQRWYLPWLQDIEFNAYIGKFQSNSILPEPVAIFLINHLCMLNQSRNINAILLRNFWTQEFTATMIMYLLQRLNGNHQAKAGLSWMPPAVTYLSTSIVLDSLRSFRYVQVTVPSFHFTHNFQPTVGQLHGPSTKFGDNPPKLLLYCSFILWVILDSI